MSKPGSMLSVWLEEKVSIEKMNELAKGNGMHLRGPHHEIYLSDPNHVPHQHLRTNPAIPGRVGMPSFGRWLKSANQSASAND